jgi:hypothetical protein
LGRKEEKMSWYVTVHPEPYRVHLSPNLTLKELNSRFDDSDIKAYEISIFQYHNQDFEQKGPNEKTFYLLECPADPKAESPLSDIHSSLIHKGFSAAGVRGLLNFGYQFPNTITYPTFGLHAVAHWGDPDAELWGIMGRDQYFYLNHVQKDRVAIKSLIKNGLADIPPEVDANGNLHPSLQNPRFLVSIENVDPEYLKQIMVP